ncbi:MAG TPA: hypothetical protein VHG72_21655 [Polyangia bacterium]|nr:hypothetical protein [Polyangia bacterium]
MMAADAWAKLANENLPGLSPEAATRLYEERMNRASRLRARVEHIRYWKARLIAFRDNPALPLDNMIGPYALSILHTLTGPELTRDTKSPAETPNKPQDAAPDEDGDCKRCGVRWSDEELKYQIAHECPPGFAETPSKEKP